MHRDKLTKSEPAKLIDVLKGFVIVAHKSSVIYFDVNRFLFPENQEQKASDYKDKELEPDRPLLT